MLRAFPECKLDYIGPIQTRDSRFYSKQRTGAGVVCAALQHHFHRNVETARTRRASLKTHDSEAPMPWVREKRWPRAAQTSGVTYSLQGKTCPRAQAEAAPVLPEALTLQQHVDSLP